MLLIMVWNVNVVNDKFVVWEWKRNCNVVGDCWEMGELKW